MFMDIAMLVENQVSGRVRGSPCFSQGLWDCRRGGVGTASSAPTCAYADPAVSCPVSPACGKQSFLIHTIFMHCVISCPLSLRIDLFLPF